MLRIASIIVIAILLVSGPAVAQYSVPGKQQAGQTAQQYQNSHQQQSGYDDPYQGADGEQVLVDLLWMVMTDLQMCGSSLTNKVMDTVSAVGHLNNAQSALRRTQLGQEYRPLVEEILSRIGKVKFYLVMQDFRNAHARLGQLIGLIRTVLHGKASQSKNGYNNNYYYNPNTYTPNGGGYVPTELPVHGGFGGGQNLNPVGAPGLPTTN